MLHGHECSAQLSDYVYVNPERKLSKGEKARCIDMSKLSTTGAFPSGWEYHPYNGGMRFTNGDTILARITPCLENGKTAMINFLEPKEVAYGSTEYIVLTPKFDYVSSGFVYCLSRYSSFVSYATRNMNGSSGRQRVSGETIALYSMPAISQNEFIEFGKETNPFFDQILSNSLENKKLETLRDLILPKLLSGEIDIMGTNS